MPSLHGVRILRPITLGSHISCQQLISHSLPPGRESTTLLTASVVEVSQAQLLISRKVALETITVTSTTPTRTGYNFLHWIDQSGETTTAGATYTVRDGHYLLYAQWQAISYSVTYDAANGSPAPSESGKTIGQSFLVAAPSREFYNFNGWSDGTNTYFPDAHI
jgi:uncharacterized repeat protein (TIGR02543 family)